MKNGTKLCFQNIFWLSFRARKHANYFIARFSSILPISHANHWKWKLCVRWFRDSHEKWDKTVLSEYFLTFIWGAETCKVFNFVVQPFCPQITWSESKASKRFVIPMKNGTKLRFQNIFWLSFGRANMGLLFLWPSSQTNYHSYVERVLKTIKNKFIVASAAALRREHLGVPILGSQVCKRRGA